MRRGRLPWLLAVPLIAAGSVSAHALGTLVFDGRAIEEGTDEVTRASGGYVAQLPILLGVVVAVTLVWFGVRILHSSRWGSPGATPLWFVTLPPVSFAVQELTERVVHAESAPFSALHEPAFLVALAIQLPFGILAYVLARLLLSVADELGRLLARSRPFPAPRRSALVLLLPVAAERRTPVLASGHSQRGPPLPIPSF